VGRGSKAPRPPAVAEPPFSAWPEKRGPKRGHPTWRLPGCARQVREPRPGFSTAHPCAGEKESTSCRLPLRGLSSPTHRRTGGLRSRSKDHHATVRNRWIRSITIDHADTVKAESQVLPPRAAVRRKVNLTCFFPRSAHAEGIGAPVVNGRNRLVRSATAAAVKIQTLNAGSSCFECHKIARSRAYSAPTTLLYFSVKSRRA